MPYIATQDKFVSGDPERRYITKGKIYRLKEYGFYEDDDGDTVWPESWPDVFQEVSEEAEPESPYHKAGRELADLIVKKQAAYGDSFGKSGEVMRIFYPEGIPTEKLDDALTIVRIVDKLFRIATDRDALGETPWMDIEGYATLARVRQEKEKK